MTPALRKTHRLIWMSLAVLFPLLFWAAISGQPKVFEQDQLYQNNHSPLPKVLRSKDTKAFLLNLRANAGRQQQLEIVIKTPLLHPAPVVYLLGKDQGVNTTKQVLGHLGTTGIYRFPISNKREITSKLAIEIFDTVQKKTLLTAEW